MEVRKGYIQTEMGVIPENWETGRLKEYFSFISYGFTNPMPTVDNGIYLITATDINNGEIQYETARFTSEFAYRTLLSSKSKPKKNDILLTKDGSLGRLAIVGDNVICINQSVAVIRPNQKVIPIYLKLLLESPTYQKKMLDDAGGSTIKHIYITVVNMMMIALPSILAEQTTIANALSDADALVQSLEKLISKKCAIKQGTMQELLTGKKRLPEFGKGTDKYKQTDVGLIPEDWEVRKLGEGADVRDGTHESPKYHKDGVTFITSKNIINGAIDYTDVTYIAQEDADNINKRSRVSKGDILMSMIGTIGNSVLIDFEPNFCIKNIALIKPKKVYGRFLIQLLFSPFYQLFINSKLAGGIQKFISLGMMRGLDIPLPPTLAEQTRIATILSDMDIEIATLETKLTKYKQIKQSMMQSLLTGRIRLV